ncbi:putative quinol monooxygenase [Kistimonas asteriae]|uniref:putative quinol monooxygenase n=1 Tax=Kistimonas asteriae TaxID=517724 RepID=UPI001BAC0854|nr:putative quinol monooxygenase [Kistimonas asteriae]
MNKPLTIIARIEARQGKVDRVKAALLKLIEPTRQEAGCLQYDLHQDNETPEVFIFYENWESRALLQRHMNSDHLKAYMEEVEGLVASFTLNEMCQIG